MGGIEEERAHEVEPETKDEDERRPCAVYGKINIIHHATHFAGRKMAMGLDYVQS